MTKTKTEGLWSRFADMLQGNKELCCRLHQQAVASEQISKPLVDELAEAIESALVWLRKIGGPSNPLWSAPIDYAIDDLETALARHQKEVDDGEAPT